MLAALVFARYRLLLEARTQVLLPEYSGSAFHGGFGAALRFTTCVGGRRCGPCVRPQRCVYGSVFEPRKSGGGDAPRPYVLEPPFAGRRRFEPGERIAVGLVLIGSALAHVERIVDAFEVLGRRGIGDGRDAGQGLFHVSDVVTTEDDALIRGDTLVGPDDRDATRATVEFLTPVRIKARVEGDRGLVDRIEFPVLMNALAGRVSDLLYYHCGSSRIDPRTYREVATSAAAVRIVGETPGWRDWERYSARQRATMQLGGVPGKICYAGPLGPAMPYLRIGEYLHVGKAVTFGLGQMRVTIEQGTDDSVLPPAGAGRGAGPGHG